MTERWPESGNSPAIHTFDSFLAEPASTVTEGFPHDMPATVAARDERKPPVAPQNGSAIAAEHLVKSYSGGRGKPAIRAVDDLGFEAAAGTVF